MQNLIFLICFVCNTSQQKRDIYNSLLCKYVKCGIAVDFGIDQYISEYNSCHCTNYKASDFESLLRETELCLSSFENLESDIDEFLSNVNIQDKKIMQNFTTNSKGFCHYLKGLVYIAFNGLKAKVPGKISHGSQSAENDTLIENIMLYMQDYIKLLNEMKNIVWKQAKVFDNTDIELTRPCVGLFLLLKNNQNPHVVRDNIKKHLILKTKDCTMHISVLIVFVKVRDSSKELPVNILKLLKRYFEKITVNFKFNKIKVSEEGVVLLGKKYLSHVCLKVEYDEVTQEWMKMINDKAKWWLLVFDFYAKLHGVKGKLHIDKGFWLEYENFNIIIRFTLNPDYKTHVTLGMIKTGNTGFDKKNISFLSNLSVERSVEFSDEQGDLARRNSNQLKSFIGATIDYLTNARLSTNTSNGAIARDAWKFIIVGKEIEIERININILNMVQLPNFETV